MRARVYGLLLATVSAFGASAHADEVSSDASNADVKDQAGLAYDRKQFLSALHLGPALYPSLLGMDAPAVAVAGVWGSKTGTPGTSQLDEEASEFAVSGASGENIFGIRVAVLWLDAGIPAADAEIGSLEPWTVRPTTRLAGGVEPKIVWRREGNIAPFAELGTTPVNGVLDPTVEGRVGAKFKLGGPTLRAEAYRRSVTDSILSYTGIVDPSTGRGFGRVVETGFKLAVGQSIGETWSVDASISAGRRTGVNIAENTHVSGDFGLSYELGLPGFDYISIGPSYSAEGFQKNLGGFTLGQGGYYSPSLSQSAGVELDFLSAEGRNFIVRGDLFLGWDSSRVADGPLFPLIDNGERIGSDHDSSISASGELTAAYKLSDRFMLAGTANFQVSPEYNDVAVGLSLKYSFGSRAALFSPDLPAFPTR